MAKLDIAYHSKMLSHLAKNSYQVTSYISKNARLNLICQYQNIYDIGITDHSTVTVTGLRLVNEMGAIMTQSKKGRWDGLREERFRSFLLKKVF